MPTYEYLCRSCGDRLEVVQSFADDALTECQACGGELRKVFSAAGLIFKGSGWHVKDYASGSQGAPGSPPSPASTKDSPASGGTSSASASGTKGGSTGDTASGPKGEKRTSTPASTD